MRQYLIVEDRLATMRESYTTYRFGTSGKLMRSSTNLDFT